MDIEQYLALRLILVQGLLAMPDHGKPFAENAIKMIKKLPDYIRPDWATYECQTLPGMIKWQLAQLEAALQGR